MKKFNLLAACAAAFFAMVFTSCERYDALQGAGGEMRSSVTTEVIKDTTAVDTTTDGTLLMTTFEMSELMPAENILAVDQKTTLVEQKGDDRKENGVQLELNGTATTVSNVVYAERLSRNYRQIRKGQRHYSDITRNHPEFVGEVEQTVRQDAWEADGHEFVIDMTEQSAVAYSAFSDTIVSLKSVRIDSAYVSNVKDVRTSETKTINDSVYVGVDREVEITYDGTVVPAVGEARTVSFKRYLKTNDGIYEFDHIVVPEDTILPPDTIPVNPDTIPVVPEPDDPGYPFVGGEITGVYSSFCIVPGSFDVLWNVSVQTVTTVAIFQFRSDGTHYVSDKVFHSPTEITVDDPSQWNSANAYGTPAKLVNSGGTARWTALDGTLQEILTQSIPMLVNEDVSIADGEMIQRIDLRTIRKVGNSTIIPIPAISGVRNAYTITVTE